MQIDHTAAEPPNQGRICLAISGWTRNSRKALVKMVPANRIRTPAIFIPGYLPKPRARNTAASGISGDQVRLDHHQLARLADLASAGSAPVARSSLRQRRKVHTSARSTSRR